MFADTEVQQRSKNLDDLQTYVKTVNSTITMILQSVNWDRNHLLNSKELLNCELDSSHRIPPDKQKKHLESCRLLNEGYERGEILLPECLCAGPSTVKIEPELAQRIIENASKSDPTFKRGARDGGAMPSSSGRLFSSFTSDERRALHDYVVSNTPKRGEDMEGLLLQDITNPSEIPKSAKELLLQSRDMKRRRTKYKVSTKSKKYTDILKEVIENQLSMYEDWLNSKNTPVGSANNAKSSDERYNSKHGIDSNSKERRDSDHKRSKDYERAYDVLSHRKCSKNYDHGQPANGKHKYKKYEDERVHHRDKDKKRRHEELRIDEGKKFKRSNHDEKYKSRSRFKES